MTSHDGKPEDVYLNEILIRPDGSVAFKHLSYELTKVALALNPADIHIQAICRLSTEEEQSE